MKGSVDVDELFRNFNVADVSEIQKRLRSDVEKKKEDLRQMVGRRYRDIIEAAEGIRAMKEMADGVLVDVREVQSGFARLQETHSRMMAIAERDKIITNYDVDFEDENQESLVSIVSDLPELVWECLDAGRPTDAVLLLDLSLRLHDKLNYENQTQLRNTMATLSRLKSRLDQDHRNFQFATKIVRGGKLCSNPQVTKGGGGVCDAIVSQIILHNHSPTDSLTWYLTNREEILGNEISEKSQTCKNLVTVCSKSLAETAQLLSKLYFVVRERKPMVGTFLSTVASSDYRIAALEEYIHVNSSWLPSQLVRILRTSNAQIPASDFADLTPPEYGHMIGQHHERTARLVTVELGGLMRYFEEISEIMSLKNHFAKLTKEESAQSDHYTTSLISSSSPDDIPRLDLWRVVLGPLLDERISGIVKEKVESMGVKVEKELELLMDKSDSSDRLPFNKLMWRELFTDVAEEFNKNSTLPLKAKGFPPDVHAITSNYTSTVTCLMEPLEAYVPLVPSPTDPCPVADGGRPLFDTLLDVGTRLCESLSDRIGATFTETSDSDRLMASAKFLSSLASRLAALKSNLISRLGEGKPEGAKRVQETVAKLESTATTGYCRWVAMTVKLTRQQILDPITSLSHPRNPESEQSAPLPTTGSQQPDPVTNNSLANAPNHDLVLATLQEWTPVELQAEDEEGAAGSDGRAEKKTTKFYIPLQCSWPLASFLHTLTLRCNSVGVHAMPRAVVECITCEAHQTIVTYLAAIVGQAPVECSRHALQMVFDLQWLGLLVSGCKPVLKKSALEESARVLRLAEERADPFDLDVLYSNGRAAVQRAVGKVALLYALILPPGSAAHLARIGATKAAQSANSDLAQLMPLASEGKRLQTVPLPVLYEEGKRKSRAAPRTQSSTMIDAKLGGAAKTSTFLEKGSSYFNRASNFFGGT